MALDKFVCYSYYVYVKLSQHRLHCGNVSERVCTCLIDDFKHCVHKRSESQYMFIQTETTKKDKRGGLNDFDL